MKLKKIEIFGFKSFADKTSLLFHPGITAVVGPNGCGKSNISDAFRWVLGEQSAKSMRGNKMHDVIFAGTTHRKPLNFAEVTITLSDVAGNLPTEFEEVSVTRRLYRNGESEYLLNRRPVRLKDVYDLFLDTGVGKNAFSIFEQGKLDQVINLSSLERRYIFEEAAGILRFLQRKREALKRLEQTEQNIERVKDIHKEVERQIIVLEQQAEKAKVYKQNKAQLDFLEIAVCCAKWENIEKRIEDVRQKGAVKRKEIEEVERLLGIAEVERQNGNIRLVHVQKELQVQKEKVYLTRSQKEIKTKEWQGSQETFREMTIKEQQWGRELDEMVLKRKKRQIESEEASRQEQKVDSELSNLDGTRKQQKEKVHHIEMGLVSVRERQHGLQKELLIYLQKENQAESEHKQCTLKLEHNEDRRRRILDHQGMRQQSIVELQKNIESKKSEVGLVSEEIVSNKERLEWLEDQIEDKGLEIKQIQAQMEGIHREKTEQKARQTVLLRLKDEMEGFSGGTKRLLTESGKASSPLHNKLKDLYESLTPHEGSEMALSVVMRRYLQTLVVQNREDFHLVAAFAKENKIRDFSLICLDTLGDDQNLILDPDSLLSRVESNLLAHHFLKNTSIVKDIDTAIEQIRQTWTGNAWTQEGVYVDSYGVAFFTSEGEKNVFLREAELKTLEKKLYELESKRTTLDERGKQLTEHRSHLQTQKKEHELSLRKTELKLVEINFSLQRLHADYEKALKEIEREQAEVNSLDHISAQITQHVAEMKQKHAEAVVKAREIQNQANSLSEQVEGRLEELKLEQDVLQQKEMAFQKISDEKRRIVHLLNVLEIKDLESMQQEKRLEEEIKAIKDRQTKLELNRVSFAAQLEEIEKNLADVQQVCGELEESFATKRNEIAIIEDTLTLKREALKRKENEIYEMGIQAAQLDSSKHTLETELLERFHLSIEEAKGKRLLLDHTLEKAEREIRSLRKQIEEAGDINMTSIEEFDKYKERYEFLNQQIFDLNLSKDELIQIITQLDAESRKIFKETFEIIRQNFKKNFQILFKGGESDLQFTEASDILEAGIDIVAKPPGKQMRSINLLSGGEKCLTAIALLFAIFEVKPAPFCILDEIDAPLDDTNVERFVNVVKQFTEKCQFIVVTHNKRTMAIADVIFGVSMQEKGVSKLLSLEFSHEKEPEPSLV